VKKVSARAIGRLSLYRFLLDNLREEGAETVFSHELAAAANCSPAQVRRDLMETNYTGSPVHGYQVAQLIESIDNFLDDPHGRNVALVGVGNLGRALLAYFRGRRPKLSIVAAFDRDPAKAGRQIHGKEVLPIEKLPDLARRMIIRMGIITVPAESAQEVADLMVGTGIRALWNFAPVTLALRPGTLIEDVQLASSLAVLSNKLARTIKLEKQQEETPDDNDNDDTSEHAARGQEI